MKTKTAYRLLAFSLGWIFILVPNSFCQNERAYINSLLDSAGIYYSRLNDSCIIKTQQAFRLAKEKNYTDLQAESKLLTGRIWTTKGQFSEAVNNLMDARNIFRDLNRPIKVAETNILLGDAFRANGNLIIALEYINNGLTSFKELNNKWGLAKSYSLLAAVYLEILFNYKFYKDSKLIPHSKERHDDKTGRLIAENYVDTVMIYSEKAIELAQEIQNIELITATENIIGTMHSFIADFDNALIHLNKALQMSERDKNISNRLIILLNLGGVYSQYKDNDIAMKYYHAVFEESTKYKIPVYIRMSAIALAGSYVTKNNYYKAYNYLWEALSNAVQTQIDAVDVKTAYFNEKIEQEKQASLLREKEQENFFLKIIFALIAFSVSLVAVIFIYKNKTQKKVNAALKEKNELIESQNEELSTLNESKDKLFSIVAHDLKNPFLSLMGYINLFDDDFDSIDDTEKREYIRRIKNITNNLNNLATNLLDWARVQSKIFSFMPVDVTLSPLFEEIKQLFDASIFKKKINFEFAVDDNLSVYCDENMLRIILNNLITNAIKFTPAEGSVSLKAEAAGEAVKIMVYDTGIGIEPERQKRIFEIGKSVSQHGTAGEKGTGLGMILVKEFVEKNKGRINIQSKIGQGTDISILLPKSKTAFENFDNIIFH